MNITDEKNLVELIGMEFYAYHGCFKEEQIIGNRFTVNFSVETEMERPGITDTLSDALNYQELYNMIKEEIEKTSKLLENVALRILERAHIDFPTIKWAQVSISKLNPPIGGKVEASRVVMSRSYKKES
ncbi:MAG: dihydroneopterin aldolase [Bacteroidetes bacterium GWF2_41_61]|nr:MAG: dihydroneopterin aldolase [Bacteroidetes bacterium GWE2_40_15]OFY27293.1 MAG: dihydroneopterin aldolase [Bacteroidetes bacterium GWF2_41_61]OFY88509.1 MAG: dihydroneopterin aldolase [Bacteroidetes bacterium RIFOXYA12_FULL_40_10]HBG23784.1 dihydroneopterin aldolase [Rikenellaceae bacterium]HBZ25968.1 dihydroneopterin aldolase [Rikenellaceae bacterium]